MTSAVAEPVRRGRHRSAAADDAILNATLEVLAADGYGALTVAAVISRARVSSATLYRRWTNKQTLVAAALASLHTELLDIDKGTLEADLATFIDGVAQTLSIRRDDLAEHVALALQRYPEFRAALNEKFLVPRLELLGRMLARAQRRGELGPDLDTEVAYSFVNGPIHHRMTVLGKPAGPTFRRAVTQAAIAALRSLSSA